MLDTKTMRAIGKIIARNAREAAKTAEANEIIDLAPLLKPWREGPQSAGDIVAHDGVPYKCVQSHDSTGNPGWTPDKTPALFAPYHATDRAHALPYAAPTGAQDAYNAGEWIIWTDGAAYLCNTDGTVWGPDVMPDAWDKEETEENNDEQSAD